MLKPQTIAIPLFAVMIAIEAFILLRRNRSAIDRWDTWTNILMGFVSVGFGFLFGLVTSLGYLFVYENSPLKMPMEAVWPWLILLFADDFLYYWFHRVSHESRFFWNFHVVHHSSNQYNLSVAVRQSWFSGMAHWVFYIPIAALGFPLWAFVLMHGLNLIYQFWIHTELIGKLGWFEYVFNTPSHHRVHHGVNPQYLDKNYAGIFIVWDRLFGTFEPEVEKVRYGITTPLTTYNPIWANIHAWVEMFEKMKSLETFGAKLRCLIMSPNMDFEEKRPPRLEAEKV
jgi:sterol desaturase/sphingolipid hydroxylase (fatty acid hydroxylase superfamily)